MTPVILARWLFTITVAGIGCWESFQQRKNRILRVPTSYLAYVTLAGILQLILRAYYPRFYFRAYWVFELLNCLFLCLLSAAVFLKLLTKEYKIIVLPCAVMLLFVSIASHMPSDAQNVLEDIGTRGSFIAGMILAFLAIIRVDWTSEYIFVTLGTLALLCAERIDASRLGRLDFIAQLIPLPGMILLSMAGSARADHWLKRSLALINRQR